MAGGQELQERDEALTALLEAERASVEVEVALASAASEYQERAAFTAMGAEDIEACCALRERLQRDEDEVSHYISRVVFDILECEHYDDRLRAFAIHQREIGRRATEILQTLDSESGLRRLLHEIVEAHVRHAALGRAARRGVRRDTAARVQGRWVGVGEDDAQCRACAR